MFSPSAMMGIRFVQHNPYCKVPTSSFEACSTKGVQDLENAAATYNEVIFKNLEKTLERIVLDSKVLSPNVMPNNTTS